MMVVLWFSFILSVSCCSSCRGASSLLPLCLVCVFILLVGHGVSWCFSNGVVSWCCSLVILVMVAPSCCSLLVLVLVFCHWCCSLVVAHGVVVGWLVMVFKVDLAMNIMFNA